MRDPGDAVGQHRTHARRRSARKHPPTTAQPRSTPTHRLHGVHHLVLVLGGGVDRLVDVLRRGSGRKLRSRSGRGRGGVRREGACRSAASPGRRGGPVHAPSFRAACATSDHAATVRRLCNGLFMAGRGRPTAGCSTTATAAATLLRARSTGRRLAATCGRNIKILFKPDSPSCFQRNPSCSCVFGGGNRSS